MTATVLLGLAMGGQASAAPSLWGPEQDIGNQAPKPSVSVELWEIGDEKGTFTPEQKPEPETEQPAESAEQPEPAKTEASKTSETSEPQPAKTETPKPEASFTVKSIDIDASELKVDKAKLAELMQECIGDGVTLSKLNGAIAQVTAYCRTHGYPASAAYLPAQEAKDGAIQIKVIPGRYGDVKLENHSKLKDGVAMRFVQGLKKGDIIRSKGLETTLYSISDVSGTKAVGVLAPGKDFGTSDVTVRIEDGKQSNTTLYAENYGSKSSGRYRYGLQQSFYDIAGTGSRASLGGLISNAHMHN